MTLERPVVVQHSWGTIGGGGPIGALARLTDSRLADEYTFVSMHQDRAIGRLDGPWIREWVRRLREIRPDIVHIRGLGNEGFHGALTAKLAGCPRILVSVHGSHRDLTGPTSFKRRVVVSALEPATLSMATHLTTVCHFAHSRPFMQQYHTKLVGPIVNGVPVTRIDGLARATHRKVMSLDDWDIAVVSVGRLSLEKGHGDLAEAVRRLPSRIRSRIVLLVVGDGPDAESIARGYQIEGLRTRMLGLRLDVPDILRAADVFAFPSWHENLSNALIEAMMAGLPVIASDVGGNSEVVSRGGGLLVPARDPLAFADCLSTLVKDDALRAMMGREARNTAVRYFSTEAMVKSVKRVYDELLGLV